MFVSWADGATSAQLTCEVSVAAEGSLHLLSVLQSEDVYALVDTLPSVPTPCASMTHRAHNLYVIFVYRGSHARAVGPETLRTLILCHHRQLDALLR
jgi:hypothetical protein